MLPAVIFSAMILIGENSPRNSERCKFDVKKRKKEIEI